MFMYDMIYIYIYIYIHTYTHTHIQYTYTYVYINMLVGGGSGACGDLLHLLRRHGALGDAQAAELLYKHTNHTIVKHDMI